MAARRPRALRPHRARRHAGVRVAWRRPVQVLVGDWAGREVATHQPVKLAAFEGLQQTEDGAPFTIGGFYDAGTGDVRFGIQIPKLLSLLAYHDPNAQVTGLDSVPEQDRPPVNIVRFAFQTMIGIGTALALLGVVFFWTRRALAAAALAVVLPCGDGSGRSRSWR